MKLVLLLVDEIHEQIKFHPIRYCHQLMMQNIYQDCPNKLQTTRRRDQFCQQLLNTNAIYNIYV